MGAPQTWLYRNLPQYERVPSPIVTSRKRHYDKKARSPNAPPIVVNRIQAVIAVAGIGRVGRTKTGSATDNANRQAVQSVPGQRQIPTGQCLVTNLLAGLRVATAVAGGRSRRSSAHNPLHLHSRQPGQPSPRPPARCRHNTGDARSMHPGPGEITARGETTANRIAWNVAKPAFGHGRPPARRFSTMETAGLECGQTCVRTWAAAFQHYGDSRPGEDTFRTGTERSPACASGCCPSS